MRFNLRRLVAALVLLAVIEGRAQAEPLVIGGFDISRGGLEPYNLASAAAFQADISQAFSNTTFATTSVLTPQFLSTINVLVITSVKDGQNIPITPLTADEQNALVNFVRAGRGAFLLTDNSFGFDAANQSLVSPFGFHSTGSTGGLVGVTVTNSQANPVTNGPFGLVTHYLTGFAGWYDHLGVNAQSLATLDLNGQTSLAFIAKGALGPGSGGVVFSSDTAPLATINNPQFPDSEILDRDIIAYLAPNSAASEPASLTLLGLGLLGLAGYGWRRRASIA